MSEYKNKEEAIAAAEKLRNSIEPKTIIDWSDEEVTVTLHVALCEFRVIARFPYPKPKPIPVRGQAVIDLDDGQVGYSGGFVDAGTLAVSEDTDERKTHDDCDTWFKRWEPVEIVKNGRYAEALELLHACSKGLYCFESTRNSTGDKVRRFLADEPKEGSL